MRPGNRFLISLAALLFCGQVLSAQDSTETPLNLGGFNNQGSVTVGYRFDDVKGYVPMFQELSDLEKGFRLMDFNILARPKREATPLRIATLCR